MSYTYSKTGQRYPDDTEGSSFEIFLMPEFWAVFALTALITFLIDRLTSPKDERICLWKEDTVYYILSMIFILSPVTLIGLHIFSISFDLFVPAYGIVYTATYCMLLLNDKWESYQSKKRKKLPPAPPAQKLPMRKDHDDTLYSVKR